jgi:hypothetical protein
LILGEYVDGRRFLPCLVIAAIALTAGCTSAAATSAAASKLGGSPAGPCAYPQALLNAGLLGDAQAQFESLLGAQYSPSAAPSSTASGRTTASASASPNSTVVACATQGLQSVEAARQAAISLEAKGDQATAEGQPAAAASDYSSALTADQSNSAAASGLQAADQEQPNGIRDARDWWNQFVSSTLQPLGQFLLWAVAIVLGLYLLFLLARAIAPRLRPLVAFPSWRPALAVLTVLSFAAALATAGNAASLGVSGRWWIGWAAVSAGLLLLGYLLLAWWMRSGTRVQCTVNTAKGDGDKTANAYLVGRLHALGAKPPRGFDLPQSTDVTTLNGALGALPGGATLSALLGFLLARVPVTPWSAVVTLIGLDELLVTLHHNGRLVYTELSNRCELFFPVPVPGKDTDAPSPYVKDIDQDGMLTVAAAIILVEMSRARWSPLQRGLNGATKWPSVAGQVLATDEGFGGNEARSKALLARAVDADPGNLAAEVAQIVLDGRRAGKSADREDFAVAIGAVCGREGLDGRGDKALRLRVFYSAAAGWNNVYLDQRDAGEPSTDALNAARDWTGKLSENVKKTSKSKRWLFCGPPTPLGELAIAMLGPVDLLAVGLLAFALDASKPNEFVSAIRVWDRDEDGWQQARKKRPWAAGLLYATACLEAARSDACKVAALNPAARAAGSADEIKAAAERYADGALKYLKEAVQVDGDLRLWARRDPSFKALLADTGPKAKFIDITGDPAPGGFTGIGPLASHAAKLTDIGIRSEADLLGLTRTEAALTQVAQAVGVPPLVVARWRDIAQLSQLPHPPSPSQLDALVAHDVDSPAQMHALLPDSKARNQIVEATVNSRGEITREQLSSWARASAPSIWVRVMSLRGS